MGKAKDCCGSSSDRDGIGSNGIMGLLALGAAVSILSAGLFASDAVHEVYQNIKEGTATLEPSMSMLMCACALFVFAFCYTTFRELNPQRVRPVWGPNG